MCRENIIRKPITYHLDLTSLLALSKWSTTRSILGILRFDRSGTLDTSRPKINACNFSLPLPFPSPNNEHNSCTSFRQPHPFTILTPILSIPNSLPSSLDRASTLWLKEPGSWILINPPCSRFCFEIGAGSFTPGSDVGWTEGSRGKRWRERGCGQARKGRKEKKSVLASRCHWLPYVGDRPPWSPPCTLRWEPRRPLPRPPPPPPSPPLSRPVGTVASLSSSFPASSSVNAYTPVT